MGSVRHATTSQIKYATDLGGDLAHISTLDFYSISSYIDELKRAKKGATVTTPAAPAVDPRLEFMKSLLPNVDDGYYAVQKDGTGPVYFIRLSRPKSGHFKGSVKVQSMHGTAAAKPSLMDAAAFWPSGRVTFYKRYQQAHWQESLIDWLMLLVTDSYGAARLYASEIGRCCRCNAALTDDNSRHYGIGPECEKYWPHIIEMVDAAEALKGS
jgi:hypothetical protein